MMKNLLTIIAILTTYCKYSQAIFCYSCFGPIFNPEPCPIPFVFLPENNVEAVSCPKIYNMCTTASTRDRDILRTYRYCSDGTIPDGIRVGHLLNLVHEHDLLHTNTTLMFSSVFNISNCNSDFCNSYEVPMKFMSDNSTQFNTSTCNTTKKAIQLFMLIVLLFLANQTINQL